MAPRSAVGGSCGIDDTGPSPGCNDLDASCSSLEEEELVFCSECGEEKTVHLTDLGEPVCKECGTSFE